MPTPTYTLIDSVTLGSSATSVTFSSISATGGGDLVLVIDGSTGGAADLLLRFNSDSGANYSKVYALAYSGGPLSGSASGATSIGNIGQFNTTQTQFTANVMDYSATDKHTSVLMRAANRDAVETQMAAGRWGNTAAVNSITCALSTASYDFAAGSTFRLLGVN